MSELHAMLAAAWDAGEDTLPLLVLTDMLEERDNPDLAELVRLHVAEATTAAHGRRWIARKAELERGVWERTRRLSWDTIFDPIEGGAALFLRDQTQNGGSFLIARPDTRSVHQLEIECDGRDEIVRSRCGAELLRCPLSPLPSSDPSTPAPRYWDGALDYEGDRFLFPARWHDDAPSRLHPWGPTGRFAPARVSFHDLPAETLPFVALKLCEYRTDRGRLAREGRVVPGAHLFLFRAAGGWQLLKTLASHTAARGATLVVQEFQRERYGDAGVVAGLLIRVAADLQVVARRLVWAHGEWVYNTPALPSRPDGTLPAEDFHAAAAMSLLDDATAERFVLDTPDKLRGLFRASVG